MAALNIRHGHGRVFTLFLKKSLDFLDFYTYLFFFLNLKEINMVDFKLRDPLECAIRNF